MTGAMDAARTSTGPLAAILPPSAAVVETRAELEARLFPEEEAAVERAVATRRREFATGRACAREALARLGLPATPIPQGAGGAPRWPAGVIGSITHCEGYRAAAVARDSDLAALGVDAEPNRPLPRGVLEAISGLGERAELAALGRREPEVSWGRLLFAVKESVYKAWFPLTGARLDWGDARVSFDRAARTFSARLRPADGRREPPPLPGRWLAGDGLLLAALALPGRSEPAEPATLFADPAHARHTGRRSSWARSNSGLSPLPSTRDRAKAPERGRVL